MKFKSVSVSHVELKKKYLEVLGYMEDNMLILKQLRPCRE
jgi:hypothetical protein